MYIYESHMGGLFTSDEEIDDDFLYCDQCGDWDWLIGYATTKEEAFNLLKDYYNWDDDGDEYIQEFINSNWDDEEEEEEC